MFHGRVFEQEIDIGTTFVTLAMLCYENIKALLCGMIFSVTLLKILLVKPV